MVSNILWIFLVESEQLTVAGSKVDLSCFGDLPVPKAMILLDRIILYTVTASNLSTVILESHQDFQSIFYCL
jgi:hypothetical protein